MDNRNLQVARIFQVLAILQSSRNGKSLAEFILKKVLAILVRAGLLNKDGEIVTNPDCDEMFRDHEGLAAASSAFIAGKIAFGLDAWRHVTKVGSGFGYYEETPLATAFENLWNAWLAVRCLMRA